MSKDFSLHINRNDLQKKQEYKFAGFDFLRAIFSIVVVALHANLFNLLSGKPGWSIVSDILTMNIGYIAVPIFIQISLFLFYINSQKFGSQYFTQKRIPKLISLYLFWVLLKVIFNALFEDFETIKIGISSFEKFIIFIISGGNTIFYFFFCLLFLTTITELLICLIDRLEKSMSKISMYSLLVFSCILVFCFPIIDLLIKQEIFTQIINYFNFLPYIFTTGIVIQEFNEDKLKKATRQFKVKMFWLFIFSICFSILEWLIFKNFPDRSRLFPHYARISLVLISWCLLYVALLSTQKLPFIVRFISSCSLGIYGFHIFFIERTDFLYTLSNVVPGLGVIIKFLLALTGSIVLTLLFRKFKHLKHFV